MVEKESHAPSLKSAMAGDAFAAPLEADDPGRFTALKLVDVLVQAARTAPAALPLVLDALVEILSARLALFFKKEAKRRRFLVGRWANASPIGRPDKLLSVSHLRRVLRSEEVTWVADGENPLRAGFPVELGSKTIGAVLFEWSVAPASLPGWSPPIEANRLAGSIALAVSLDSLKDENRRLHLDLAAGAQGAQPAHAFPYPPPLRAILEYPIAVETRNEPAVELRSQFPEIVGKSAAIRAVLQAVVTAARSDIPILIEGESGTGKELVARAIHRDSRRAKAPFISENCGAVPESLIESEFFGHEKGAFTGAHDVNLGLFERAHGGTVLLDEIGEMDLSMQKRLLRVLQEKEIRRIGGQRTIAVDFRVVSATNRVLEDLVAAKKFREDLYYRLNVAAIYMPTLRERPEDVPLLVGHFNMIFAAGTGKEPLAFSEDALSALCAYPWPGNVRELRNEVWRLASGDLSQVSPVSLSRRILRGSKDSKPHPDGASSRRLDEIEREVLGTVLLDAIRRAKGNRAEAARQLGITRASLYRRLARYKLLPGVRSQEAP